MRTLRKNILALGVFLSIAFISIALAGCSSSKSSSDDSSSKDIKIVATTDFYGEAAKKVVGNKGTVNSVINNPSVDPHDYDPTSKIANEVSKADVVVASGIDYDPWMSKLVKNSKSSTKYIKIGEDVLGKKSGDNPHIWYDPTTMPKYVNFLANKLSKIQPKNKKYFHDNAKKYIKSLQAVNAEISRLKKLADKKTNSEVYVSEPVFDYALTALGYKVANTNFENAMEKGTDPSAKEIQTMEKGIKNHKIVFFVYNKQVSDKTVTNFVKLAKQYNVPVLKVTETLPAHMNYKQWMLSQYKELDNILTKVNRESK